MAEKRMVAMEEKKGFSVQDLILIAVLIAAGAVLKLTVSSFLTFAGMKPNFMIALYCLAIILTKPKPYQAIVIGLLVGLVSQIPLLNATPMVNFASEALGALVCGLLVMGAAKIAPESKTCQNVVLPVIITFVTTLFSGYCFALIVGAGINHVAVAAVLAMYAPMVFGTAAMIAVAAAILTPVLKTVLKK